MQFVVSSEAGGARARSAAANASGRAVDVGFTDGDTAPGRALTGVTLFDTAIGRCALAWSPSGIAGVQLPEENDAATLARLLAFTGPMLQAEPSLEMRSAVSHITALLAGEAHDFSAVVLDFSRLTPFRQRVYRATCAIAPGETCTYGDLAAQLGNRQGARAVGQALGFNPFAPVVPCHRVLAAGGRPGGFSAHGGTCTKLRMLLAEKQVYSRV